MSYAVHCDALSRVEANPVEVSHFYSTFSFLLPRLTYNPVRLGD